MLLVQIQAQAIYQTKSQHQLRKNPILNPKKGKQTRAQPPTRSHSKTNYTQNEQTTLQTKEIEELK